MKSARATSMIKENRWNIPPNAPACMEKHLCAARYRAAISMIAVWILDQDSRFPQTHVIINYGTLLIGASNLSGRNWQGSVWIYSEPEQAPSEGFCKAGVQTEAGVTDVSWVAEKRIVATSDSGALELWELAENEHLLVNRFTRYDHDNVVTTVSPVVGGSGAVTGSMDCRIKVWDLGQETVVTTYNVHTQPVNSVACSPTDESLFISCGQDGRVLMWDKRKPNKPASKIDVESSNCSATTVAWHPHHRSTVAFGDELGRVTVKDFLGTEPARVKTVHSRRVNSLAFSTNSDALLASTSDDCSLAVVNAELQEVLRDRRHQDFVTGVCWLHGSSTALTTVGWDHLVLHHTVTPAAGSSDSSS